MRQAAWQKTPMIFFEKCKKGGESLDFLGQLEEVGPLVGKR